MLPLRDKTWPAYITSRLLLAVQLQPEVQRLEKTVPQTASSYNVLFTAELLRVVASVAIQCINHHDMKISIT